MHFIKTHIHLLILFLCIIVYCSYFIPASILRYTNFYTGRYDLGNMDQTVWNTTQGRIFQTTNSPYEINVSRLSAHADFILIFLAPFYLIWSDPRMLLIIQTIILALGALFVYRIGQLLIHQNFASLLIALCYLLNPSLQYTNLYDFHAVTLATSFLLATTYFFLTKKYFLAILFGILSAFTKEQVWVIVGLYGLFFSIHALRQNNTSFAKRIPHIIKGITITLICGIIFFFLMEYAIPQSRGGIGHFALEYFDSYGNSPTSIITSLLFSPHKIIPLFFEADRINYLRQLFTPLGFLPLIAPWFLLFAVPDLLINILSKNVQLHQIYYQYTAVITPFLFISTLYAIQYIHSKIKFISPLGLAFFVTWSTLLSAYQLGPLPFSKHPNIDMFVKQYPYKKEIAQALSRIPNSASVSASNSIGSHLSQRETIYVLPDGLYKADYVVIFAGKSDDITFAKNEKEIARNLKKNPQYALLYEKENFFLFQKK